MLLIDATFFRGERPGYRINILKLSFKAYFNISVLTFIWIIGCVQAQSTPVRYPDSPGYILGSSASDSASLSFEGNSFRAWPTSLFFALSDSDTSRVLYQSLFYLSAVTLFILTTTMKKSGLASYVGSLLLSSLFLSANVFQWNLAILSESTTLSFVLIALSFSYLSFESKQKSTLYFLAGEFFLLLACLTRPYLIVLMFIIGMIWLRKHFSIQKLAIASSVLLVFAFYIIGVNANINKYWGGDDSKGVTRNAISFYYLTSTDTRIDDLTNSLFRALPTDSPECLREKSSRASFKKEPGPYNFVAIEITRCPSGIKWVNDNFVNFYVKFLFENPSYVFRTILTFFPDSISESSYTTLELKIFSILNTLWTTNTASPQHLIPFFLWFGIPPILMTFRTFRTDSKGMTDSFLMWVGLNISLLGTYLLMNSESSRIGSISAYPAVALSIVILTTFIDKFSWKSKST
jgi:hypothetical protein